MNVLHLMKDYKPTIGGSVIRNSNMIEKYKETYPSDNIFLIDLEGNLYESESIENNIHVYRASDIKGLIRRATEVIALNDIDIIHAHNFRFLLVAYVSKIFSKKKKVKLIFEIHAMYTMSWYKQLISLCLMRKVDKFIVLADCAKAYLIEKYRISTEKIAVVRNGTDDLCKELPIKDTDLQYSMFHLSENYCVLLYSGSFHEWQGVNFIANNIDELLKNNPGLAIVMIGNGPEYNYVLEKLNNSRYKERIIIHCGIPKGEILNLYKLCDAILIPRVKNLSTNTAVPLKVIEAMKYEKCIVAGNDNGLLEVLDQSNAILFESQNLDSLNIAIKRIIEDPELRSNLASKAKNDAESMFVSWKENAKKINAIYLGE